MVRVNIKPNQVSQKDTILRIHQLIIKLLAFVEMIIELVL